MRRSFYNQYLPVLPSNTVDGPFPAGLSGQPGLFEAVMVTAPLAGETITIVDEGGLAVTFVNPAPNHPLPIRGRRVNLTGTTVVNIVALRQM